MFNSRIWFVLCVLILSCRQEKRYHDVKEEVVAVANNDKLAAILEFQKELNSEFKDPEVSPLADRHRKNFEGLEFFKPDTNYVVQAKFMRTPDALPFLMPTSTDRKSEEVVYAIVEFQLKGKTYELEVYQNPELILEEKYTDYLFLPFTDLTNGKETYGGGRYLDLRIPDGNTIVIDFNKAYNPYCAYNKKYSCPLVPSVNNLSTKILAGVKAFKK
ncbi:DUF1684 domain-containing protein [Maribacter sp. MJ134]|uniref:DUF1684 domain-containing protein n=1 Tax=Maribacter sp. MJ134 TaxID=2496865 RepID=UPI000F84224B|nr:DUF1684 domain-containing protein [Maribacter sp. MJ134]AZQ58812.1 DUF1684 domain-containing protein [Maribacter sp. MJ134]